MTNKKENSKKKTAIRATKKNAQLSKADLTIKVKELQAINSELNSKSVTMHNILSKASNKANSIEVPKWWQVWKFRTFWAVVKELLAFLEENLLSSSK